MEAGDSGARQSGHSSANSTHSNNTNSTAGPEQPPQSHPAPYQPREPLDRPYREHPAMATATVLNPTAHYQAQSAYPSPYPQPGPAPSISNMISSAEPRRPNDDNDVPTRQSLPSISEVISGAPGQYAPPPHHSMQHGSSLPSPFAPISRSSPQPIHPAASFPPRQDALPSFTDSPRSAPFNGRPSLPPVSDRRPSPTGPDGPPQHHVHESQRPSEPHALNGAYPHQHPQPPPPPHHASAPLHGNPLPPGQVSLPGYPVSPRHGAPLHLPGQYDPRPNLPHPDEAEYARTRYDAVNRHFENWSYQEGLSGIGSSSRTVFNFAEAYGRLAQEQHSSSLALIPERLPTESEVGEMLANVELIKRSLEQVREMVQISIQNERAREGAKVKGAYEEEHDVAMYGGGMKSQYAIPDVKKRRGRAAPPGRCHSCNRIDTPEWRRGPDGARTLCNACGLHYAKLERKRQLEARSIRPKPEERN